MEEKLKIGKCKAIRDWISKVFGSDHLKKQDARKQPSPASFLHYFFNLLVNICRKCYTAINETQNTQIKIGLII